ncbi:S1C family serine protease [Macrococcoides caseolyticum]|uniref:S1C family serine protease n=1 Tax=Macrococcoides caseolyticum TaxID=69966 RepID=UPI001F2DD0ED|nr:S1C family serine protease [Macrococcus caseolyticus]MCE4955703.1 serine protease [Macrococcus caseolyticus]
MQHKHKIVIKKRNYKRPKRLFFKGQKLRMIYPYLHKEDDEVTAIPPHEEVSPKIPTEDKVMMREGADTTNIQATDDIQSDANVTTESNDMQSNDTRPKATRHTETPPSEKHETTLQEQPKVSSAHDETTNEIIKASADTTDSKKAYNDDTHETKPSKSIWPKVFMGALVGILIGILLMSLLHQPEQRKAVESQPTIEQSIKRNMNNVVSVTNLQKTDDSSIDPESAVKPPEEVGIGTGVIYKLDDKSAYILTNYHVVGKASEIEVTYGEQKEKAKMIGYDVWTDIAILMIPKRNLNTVVEMADSKNLAPGQQVYAMGSPLGKIFEGSVSTGIISGLKREVPVDIDGDEIYDWEMSVMQTDAAINPGNSGGPLFNKAGKMIGLNSMKIAMNGVEGIAFSIPSNDVLKVIKELEQNGSIKRAKIGIMIENAGTPTNPNDPNSKPNKEGVIITQIEPNSVAQKQGLLPGDVITKIDGKSVKSKIHFRKILFYEKKIGDTITMTYQRNGKTVDVKVTL